MCTYTSPSPAHEHARQYTDSPPLAFSFLPYLYLERGPTHGYYRCIGTINFHHYDHCQRCQGGRTPRSLGIHCPRDYGDVTLRYLHTYRISFLNFKYFDCLKYSPFAFRLYRKIRNLLVSKRQILRSKFFFNYHFTQIFSA